MEDWLEWFRSNFDFVIDFIDEDHEQTAIVKAVANFINKKVDMPFIGEDVEQTLIEKVLEPIADKIFDAFTTVKMERSA